MLNEAGVPQIDLRSIPSFLRKTFSKKEPTEFAIKVLTFQDLDCIAFAVSGLISIPSDVNVCTASNAKVITLLSIDS